MRDLPLQEIITAHLDALAAHVQEFLPMIRLLLLLDEGPISPERFANVLHWTASEVEAFLSQSGLVIDPEGHIQTVVGAGCALDTLLAPILTGRSTAVVSLCPATGKEIRLTVTRQGIRDVNPLGAVLSLRLPDRETSASNARETICAYGHFFVDREHAATWSGPHSDAVLLSVEDAAHLAREIAQAARMHVERAGN